MTTLQKAIVAAALAAAVGTGIYAVHHSSQLSGQIQALRQERAPLTAQIQHWEEERTQTSNELAALREENTRLKSGRTEAELLKLRGQVGTLRQQGGSNPSQAGQPSGGLAKMMNDPAMKEYMRRAMMDKLKSLYGDFIQELKLTPEQTDQFLELLSDAGSKNLARLTASTESHAAAPDAEKPQDVGAQLRALLGDAGSARFKEFSDEMPARATLNLLNTQLGPTPLTEQQSASLIRIIKAEPADMTQGILGSPDKAFLGSQADIDAFLDQVAQSNQRILQQARSDLAPEQLAALENVLTKAIEARKLQGAAFFQKH